MYAHVALHRFNMRPSEFLELDRKEKAFMIASIDIVLAEEKRQHDKIKNN